MTDKVQKILSEITTRKLCTMDEHMAFYNNNAKEDYRFLSEIEEFIKASQEEPISKQNLSNVERTGKNWEKLVSEDLETFAKKESEAFAECEYEIGYFDRNALGKGYYWGCIDGAKFQKEQMMANATEVTVHIEAGNYPYIPQLELYDYEKDVPLAKEGDKYKVILIKED